MSSSFSGRGTVVAASDRVRPDRPVQAITLDFFNTLVFHREGRGRGKVLIDYLTDHDLEPAPWEHRVLYDIFDRHDVDYSPERSATEKQGYRHNFAIRVFERLGIRGEPELAARHATGLWEILGPACFGVFDEVREALEDLRSRGFPLAVLSNWQRGLAHFCVELDIADSFDHIISSDEVGFEKPDAQIFHEAARRLGVPLEGILHVGDTVLDDYEGGQAAGVNVLLVSRASDPEHEELNTIRDLRDLLDILPAHR